MSYIRLELLEDIEKYLDPLNILDNKVSQIETIQELGILHKNVELIFKKKKEIFRIENMRKEIGNKFRYWKNLSQNSMINLNIIAREKKFNLLFPCIIDLSLEDYNLHIITKGEWCNYRPLVGLYKIDVILPDKTKEYIRDTFTFPTENLICYLLF